MTLVFYRSSPTIPHVLMLEILLQYSLFECVRVSAGKSLLTKNIPWWILLEGKIKVLFCNLRQGVSCQPPPAPSSPLPWVREGLVIVNHCQADLTHCDPHRTVITRHNVPQLTVNIRAKAKIWS